ncbi:MAG TPA: hypothetical protein VGK89_02035 [Candidatus Eisenbacteria bacterium]
MKRIPLPLLLLLCAALALPSPAAAKSKTPKESKPAAEKHEKAPKPPKAPKAEKAPKVAKAPKAPKERTPLKPSAWVLGLNMGAGSLDMEGDPLGRKSGTMTQFRVGHVVAPGVLAGFQARGWTGSQSGLDRRLEIITATATAYPSARHFYVRGGGGVCEERVETLAPAGSGGVWQQDAGFAATAAAGYDFRIRQSLGLGLEAEYARVVAAHIGGNLMTYTLGLSLYW